MLSLGRLLSFLALSTLCTKVFAPKRSRRKPHLEELEARQLLATAGAVIAYHYPANTSDQSDQPSIIQIDPFNNNAQTTLTGLSFPRNGSGVLGANTVQDIAEGPGGVIYLAGNPTGSGSSSALGIYKLGTTPGSFTLISSVQAQRIAVDGSGNVIALQETPTSGTTGTAKILKVNPSNGSSTDLADFTYTRNLYDTAGAPGIAAAPNGNIFFAGDPGSTNIDGIYQLGTTPGSFTLLNSTHTEYLAVAPNGDVVGLQDNVTPRTSGSASIIRIDHTSGAVSTVGQISYTRDLYSPFTDLTVAPNNTIYFSGDPGSPHTAGVFQLGTTAGSFTQVSSTVVDNLSSFANIVVGPAGLPAATVGKSYSSPTFTATGGSGTGYTFAETGTLPAGVTFNTTTDQLTGAPTQSGTFSNIVITVTDNEGGTGSAAYTLAVNPPIVVAPTTLPNGMAGNAYTSPTFTATGGSGTGYTFAETGALPTGVTFNTTTDQVTGTPTQSGTFPNIVITVTDNEGGTGSAAYTLTVNPAAGQIQGSPQGYSPSQIQQAYGFDSENFANGTTPVVANGAGQTIAIVVAFQQPNIMADLQTFSTDYGLPLFNQPGTSTFPGNPTFTVVPAGGGSIPLAPRGDWGLEASLDVEWAHALAPEANLVLVEAPSAGTDLFSAVDTARQLPAVSVISMSWGFPEFSTETSYDQYFTTPQGHIGEIFIAASGDIGAPGEYPAYSPNVLAVGGTAFDASLDALGDYPGEVGWNNGGGGVSQFENQPSFQTGVVTQSTSARTIPDVSFDAANGVAVYDSYDEGASTPWISETGTSLGAPSWAALLAAADQGRALLSQPTLTSAAANTALYGLAATSSAGSINDITSGNNGRFMAGPGYDLVTGLGTPTVAALEGRLQSAASTSIFAAFTQLAAPTPNSTNILSATTPVFQWSPVPGAVGYELVVSATSTSSGSLGNVILSATLGNVTSYTANTQLPVGSIVEWSVLAIGSAGNESVFSTPVQFTAASSPPVVPPVVPPPGSKPVDELGAYRASNGSWSLDSDGTPGFDGATDQVFFSFSPGGVTGVAGDWTGSGHTDIGDFSNGTWHLDLNDNGVLDAGETFQFGQAGDQPVVGDWDGNASGRDEIGVFRTASDGVTGEFILDTNDDHSMDAGDTTFTFGLGTDHIIVGDWNGAGTSEVGVYRDAANYIAADAGDIVFSINSSGDHATFTNFVFGLITDKVIIGDWNGNDISKVGVYRDGASAPAGNALYAPGTALFTLDTNGNLQYDAGIDQVFLYGLYSDQFLSGHWAKTPPFQVEGTPQAQFAANGPGPGGVAPLTQARLEPVLDQAIAAWVTDGASATQLDSVQVQIGTLDDNLIGLTSGNQITLDSMADGWGWNTDSSNADFTTSGPNGLQATPGSAAAGQMDLLTVVEHELSHELGLSDVDPTLHPTSLVASTLPVGTRRTI